MKVESIRIHPYYDEYHVQYDYGIVRTVGEIVFSPVVNAACLPSFTDPTKTDGKSMTISGWGLTQNEDFEDPYDDVHTNFLNVANARGIAQELQHFSFLQVPKLQAASFVSHFSPTNSRRNF